MRQEAGSELGPSALAALATIERAGPLTPSELAKQERIKPPTATRIIGRLVEEGLVTRTADPDRRSLRDRHRHRRRARAPEAAPEPQERLPGATDERASRRRRGRAGARRRDPRAGARGRARLSRALRKSFASLQVPNYRLYFGGQVVSLAGNWMQIVAELWLILQITGSGTAVGIATALQFTGILLFGALGGSLADRFDKRAPADPQPDRDGGPGRDARRPRRDRRRRGLDGLRADRPPRPRPARRQPGPAELRDRDRRARARGQRRRPQQRPDPLRPDHRAGDRRRRHRHRAASRSASPSTRSPSSRCWSRSSG